MKWLAILPLLMLVSSCATEANDSAVCDGTAGLRTAHAAALVDAPDAAVVTGAKLIRAIDAACR